MLFIFICDAINKNLIQKISMLCHDRLVCTHIFANLLVVQPTFYLIINIITNLLFFIFQNNLRFKQNMIIMQFSNQFNLKNPNINHIYSCHSNKPQSYQLI